MKYQMGFSNGKWSEAAESDVGVRVEVGMCEGESSGMRVTPPHLSLPSLLGTLWVIYGKTLIRCSPSPKLVQLYHFQHYQLHLFLGFHSLNWFSTNWLILPPSSLPNLKWWQTGSEKLHNLIQVSISPGVSAVSSVSTCHNLRVHRI